MNAELPNLPPVRADGLQVKEDRRAQERIWTTERVSHIALLLITLAALAGFAGSGGFFARATIGSEAGTVDYPRILRWETAEDLTIRFAEAAQTHRLRLSGPVPDGLYVESIQPQPTEARAAHDGITYDFAAEDEPLTGATLRIRASGPGLVNLGIALDDAPPVQATSVVLP